MQEANKPKRPRSKTFERFTNGHPHDTLMTRISALSVVVTRDSNAVMDL